MNWLNIYIIIGFLFMLYYINVYRNNKDSFPYGYKDYQFWLSMLALSALWPIMACFLLYDSVMDIWEDPK